MFKEEHTHIGAYISTGAYASHEDIPHGPLFSDKRKLRWNERATTFQSILMTWDGIGVWYHCYYWQ